jgi:hypothetical protein
MNMDQEETEIEKEAVRWVRRDGNKRLILDKYSSIESYPPSKHPLIIFTAGSPGAGKTEFIKSFSQSIGQVLETKVASINPDVIRELLPGYTGSNSFLFQRAVSIAVDDLFRSVIKNKQSAFIDGTLSDYNRAYQNISKVIDEYGLAMICFVFQHPSIAWHFTQLREKVEGRNIQKNDFIEKFLGSKQTADKIKAEFGDKLILNVILKDYKDAENNKAVAKVYTNVMSIDQCFKVNYTKNELKRIIQ